MYPTENPTENVIRARREQFNSAIAGKDVHTIYSMLAPNYHIVTGRSAQSHGADEEAGRWTEMFRTDPTTFYRRVTRDVTINEEWGMAEELGNWKGNYSFDNIPVHVSGVYSAKWQRTLTGEWVLLAEIFTTLTCTGPEGGCIPPDPIPG